MGESLNEKFSKMFGKVDEKIVKMKINSALDMLKNGSTEELAKKINKLDKEEILSNLSKFNSDKLKELNINKAELSQKITDNDLNMLASLLGDQGDMIVKKFKQILAEE